VCAVQSHGSRGRTPGSVLIWILTIVLVLFPLAKEELRNYHSFARQVYTVVNQCGSHVARRSIGIDLLHLKYESSLMFFRHRPRLVVNAANDHGEDAIRDSEGRVVLDYIDWRPLDNLCVGWFGHSKIKFPLQGRVWLYCNSPISKPFQVDALSIFVPTPVLTWRNIRSAIISLPLKRLSENIVSHRRVVRLEPHGGMRGLDSPSILHQNGKNNRGGAVMESDWIDDSSERDADRRSLGFNQLLGSGKLFCRKVSKSLGSIGLLASRTGEIMRCLRLKFHLVNEVSCPVGLFSGSNSQIVSILSSTVNFVKLPAGKNAIDKSGYRSQAGKNDEQLIVNRNRTPFFAEGAVLPGTAILAGITCIGISCYWLILGVCFGFRRAYLTAAMLLLSGIALLNAGLWLLLYHTKT
jgi:hypothetical protein